MPLLQLLQFCWNIVFGQLKFANGLETVATGSVRTEHCIYRCAYLYRNASCVVCPIHAQCPVEAYMFVNIKSVVFLESRWFLLHVRNTLKDSAADCDNFSMLPSSLKSPLSSCTLKLLFCERKQSGFDGASLPLLSDVWFAAIV